MAITSPIRRSEIAGLVDRRRKDSQKEIKVERLLQEAATFVKRAGLTDATIDFLRRPNGAIAEGSARIPLVVTSPDHPSFVVKRYDMYDAQQEIAVLRRVSGNIGPKVFYMSPTMYAEELLDHSKALWYMIYDSDDRHATLEQALDISAGLYAFLSRMGIIYDHNHFLDEFYITDKGLKITDWGTARFFSQELGKNEAFNEVFTQISSVGLEAYLLGREPWRVYFANDLKRNPEYPFVVSNLVGLNLNPVAATNVLLELSKVYDAVHIAFESFFSDVFSGWEPAKKVFPRFIRMFAQRYKQSDDMYADQGYRLDEISVIKEI